MAPSPGGKRNYLKERKPKEKSISTTTITPQFDEEKTDSAAVGQQQKQRQQRLTTFELPKTHDEIVRLTSPRPPPPQSPRGVGTLKAPPTSPDGNYINQMARTINEAATTLMLNTCEQQPRVVDREFSDTMATKEAQLFAREIQTIAPQLTASQLEQQQQAAAGQSPRSYVDAISQTFSLDDGGKVIRVVRIKQPIAQKFVIQKATNPTVRKDINKRDTNYK